MSFSIKIFPAPMNGAAISPVWGQITLGDLVESFPLMTSLWPAEEYERQWATAIQALLHRRVSRALLVTDIEPTQDNDAISYFVLFVEGSDVFVRQRFMRPAPRVDVRVPEIIEPIIPPRFRDKEGDRNVVSEWCVSIDDLQDFCASS